MIDIASSALKVLAFFTVVISAFAMSSAIHSRWQRTAGQREVEEVLKNPRRVLASHHAICDLLHNWMTPETVWTEQLAKQFALMHNIKFVPFSKPARLHLLRHAEDGPTVGYFEFDSPEHVTLFLLSAKGTHDNYR